MSDDFPPVAPHVLPEGYELINWTRGFGRQIGPLYDKPDTGSGYTRGFFVEEHHTNGMGNAHGGMLMSFADMALGHAVSVERSYWWVTVRLLCDFLSGAKLGDFIEGNGIVTGIEDDIFTVKGRIWCGDRTIMTATGIFKAVERREPRKGEKLFSKPA
jgi:acyl-coenzyme A thioesterase PaaI-like protein